MKSLVLICLLTSLFICNTTAQIFIPKEIEAAVGKGTRTFSGIPGEKYFQNSADYTIHVRFDPVKGVIDGKADILYFNNSPDSLNKIVLHLYQNFFKKGGIRDMEADPSNIHDGVVIRSLYIGEDDYTAGGRLISEGTILTILLKNKIHSGTVCSIKVEWMVPFPSKAVERFGKYGDGTYFVGYWYPQVAVYDDIYGWDLLQFNGTQEFYNDFSNYYVNITVPAGYMVWAPGLWMNPEYILSTDVMNRMRQAIKSEKVIRILTPDDLQNRNWYQGKKDKTFRFKAENIPDFAFAVSNRYVWDAATIMLGSKPVLVSTAYPYGTPIFHDAIVSAQESLKEISENTYGIPYPYDKITIFKGEGGMEYPMMINLGASSADDFSCILNHEIAHAYFPFMTGINEKKYAWIDEGLTTLLTSLNNKDSRYCNLTTGVNYYSAFAGLADDLPLSVSSFYTKGTVYNRNVYTKSSVAFAMLRLYIGPDTFRMALQKFADIWKSRHPTPYDLFAVFESVSSKELKWFTDAWFFRNGVPDLAIDKVTLAGNTIKIDVLNKGTLPVPGMIELYFMDGQKEEYLINPEVWKKGDRISLNFMITDEPKSIRLGNEQIPDIHPEDNIFDFNTEE